MLCSDLTRECALATEAWSSRAARPRLYGQFGLVQTPRLREDLGLFNANKGSLIDFCGHTTRKLKEKKSCKYVIFSFFQNAHQIKNITRSTSEPRLLPRPIVYSSTVENLRPLTLSDELRHSRPSVTQESTQIAGASSRPDRTSNNMDMHALEQEVLALEHEICEDWVLVLTLRCTGFDVAVH